MNSKSLSLVLISCCLFSCNNPDKIEQLTTITSIELNEALDNKTLINATDIGIKDFEYVRLETNESTLNLSNPYLVDILDQDKLIVKYFRQMALFDRSTGEYLRDIGHYGDDPLAYGSVTKRVNDRKYLKRVSALSKKAEIIEYDIETGEISNRMPVQKVLVNYDTLLHPSPYRIYDIYFQDMNNIFGFLTNVSGTSPYRLIHFNSKGKLLNFHKSGQAIDEPNDIGVAYPGEAIFYEYEKELKFKERYGDTLFIVSDQKLIPEYIFRLGDKSPPYQDKNKHSFPNRAAYDRFIREEPYYDRTVYAFIEEIVETDSHLLFSFIYQEMTYYGFYEKETSKTKVSGLNPGLKYGYENNLDGFIPFYPQLYDKSTNSLIGFVNALEVADWFDNHKDQINSLPEHLKSFKDIAPEDNPIVMIGKLK